MGALITCNVAWADDADLDLRLKNIESRMDRVEKLLGVLLKLPEDRGVPEGSTIPGSPVDVGSEEESKLVLTRWAAVYRGCGYSSSCYRVTYSLKNNYDKPIKLLDAVIVFYDLLGAKIYGIKAKQDVMIIPSKEVSFSGDYEVNQFLPDQLRLKEMPAADVQAKLRVSRLVFSDNTKLEIK